MQIRRPFEIIVPKTLPDIVKGKRNADAICYLMHYVWLQPAIKKRIDEKNDGFVPINKKKLTKLIHCDIDSCIKFLEKNDFLESDKKYIPNRKSYYYRPKATSFQVYSITEESPLYERLAKKYKAKKTNYSRLEPHLNKMVKKYDKIEYDKEAAIEWINNNATGNKAASYLVSVIMFSDRRRRFFKRNSTNKRADTGLTNMKSDLRKFVKQDLVQIDLKNSQSFFLMVVLKYMKNFTKDNDKDKVQTYSYPLCSDFESLDIVHLIGNHKLNTNSKIRKICDFSKNTTFWSTEFMKFMQWVSTGLFYDNMAKEYNKKSGNESISRSQAKDTMFKVLFSKNTEYRNNKKFTPYKKEKDIFKEVFPSIAEIITILKEKDHTQLAILLQTIESIVFIDYIAKELVNNNIIPLTIHDSILVEPEHEQKALSIVKNVFKRLFGIVPTFSIEPLHDKQTSFKLELMSKTDWSNEIMELENYFSGIELPTYPVRLNQCSVITDCSLFVESHLSVVKANNGNKTYSPYLDGLIEFKNILTNFNPINKR
ncbi:MAG: hypothetical protein WCR58_12310 [Bacteroidales bacterium]|jgi:hypothetical protein|nr:hypothetical protein [Bacteroidales bacterium]MCK9448881.1 hypothetical protein [Bacteroidales bacterium]MDD3700900.1 hypothetical protein [Bacteroidales bacterium]MDY0370044.1 hypothetical protein [Bacteroidales bacterium]